MRELYDVIGQMLKVVPKEEEEIIAVLTDNQSSASYAPPEGMQLWWEEVAGNLAYWFGEEGPSGGWQKEVVDIWMDRKTDSVKDKS